VDDPLLVRVLEGQGDLLRDLERLVGGDRAALQSLGQVFPFDQLENQERFVVRFVQAVDRGDVRVIERREHLRFTLEPGESLRVCCHVGGQDLDRDVAPELLVARAIDLAHSALAEFGDDLVGAEAISRGQWQEVAPSSPKTAPRSPAATTRRAVT